MRYETNITHYPDVVKLVQNEIRESGDTYRQIAKVTKLNPTTISKIAYGETKQPQYKTLSLLLIYFGYGLYARRGTNIVNLQTRNTA